MRLFHAGDILKRSDYYLNTFFSRQIREEVRKEVYEFVDLHPLNGSCIVTVVSSSRREVGGTMLCSCKYLTLHEEQA